MKQQQFTLTHVEATDEYVLQLSFADGFRASVCLAEPIRRHRSLRSLLDPQIFRRVRPDCWNLGVIFNDDDDLSLASDSLRAWAIEQAGGFSHLQVMAWMAHHGLTLDAAALALGVSRRMLAYYRSGRRPIPRPIGLAMVGWGIVETRGVGAVLHYDAA